MSEPQWTQGPIMAYNGGTAYPHMYSIMDRLCNKLHHQYKHSINDRHCLRHGGNRYDLTPFLSFHWTITLISLDPIPMCLSVFRTFRIVPIICNTTSHVLSPVTFRFHGLQDNRAHRALLIMLYTLLHPSELWVGCYAIGYYHTLDVGVQPLPSSI